MANDNNDPNSVNTSSEAPMNSPYLDKESAIRRSFEASTQAASRSAEEEIAKRQIVSDREQKKIREKHYSKEKTKAARQLHTLSSPSRVSSEVGTLAHQEATRKRITGSQSSLLGMPDIVLEQGYQEDMVRAQEFRQKAANATRTAEIVNGKPKLGKSYEEDIAAGSQFAQRAAEKKAAMIEKRRVGASDVKVESAMQEAIERRAEFTQDETIKKQVKENTLTRKEVESQYNKKYELFEAEKRNKEEQTSKAQVLTNTKTMKEDVLNQALESRRIETGGTVSAEDLISQDTGLQNIKKEIEELTESLKTLGNESIETNNNLIKYNDELAKQERLLKAMPKGGAAGFLEQGGGDAMIEAMGTAAQMFRRHMVGIPMREEKAKAGIANLALNRYNKQYAATQGDMASYYEIVEDAGGAEAFGKQMALRGQFSSGIEAGLDITTAGMDVANIALGGGTGQGVDKGLAKGAKYLAKGMKGFEALAKGADENAVIGAETKLEAIMTRDQFNSAISAIRSQGGQALYNQAMGAANVSIGAGDSRALEEKLSSVGGMQDALDRGNLSPEQFRQVTAQVGASVYGANQDRGEIAIRAGELQKKRVMTTDQFTQAMGIQSAAGGSLTGLESTLKRAVSAGVNDSKLLVEFAQLSANLNQSLTNIGVSAENHTAYANKVQQLKEAGASEVLATRSAASQIGSLDSILRDTSMNEGSLMKSAKIQEILGPGATAAERYILQTADTGELGMLTKKTLTEAEQKSIKLKGPAFESARKKIQADLPNQRRRLEDMAEISVMYGPTGTGGAMGMTDESKEITARIQGRSFVPGQKPIDLNSVEGKEFKNQAGTAEDQMKNQGQAALNQIQQAATALGGVKETFEAITKSLQLITKNLDANAVADKARKDADNLDPDGKFGAAVGKFDDAVEKMRGKMGIDPVAKAGGDNSSKKVNWKSENTGGKMGKNGQTGSW